MVSGVTEKYFEELDKFDLISPFDIKEAIKAKIRDLEHGNDLLYSELSGRTGVSVEEIKKLLQNAIENLINDYDGFIAIHSENGYDKAPFRLLCESGKFKSLFESKFVKKSYLEGDLNQYLMGRSENEFKALNFPNDIKENIESRPIYGYLANNGHGIVDSPFGSIYCKIKREKLLESALIFGNADQDFKTIAPFGLPHFSLFDIILEKSKNIVFKEIKEFIEFSLKELVRNSQHWLRLINMNKLYLSDIEKVTAIKSEKYLVDIGLIYAPCYRTVSKSLNQKIRNIKENLSLYKSWSGINIPLEIYDENFNRVE